MVHKCEPRWKTKITFTPTNCFQISSCLICCIWTKQHSYSTWVNQKNPQSRPTGNCRAGQWFCWQIFYLSFFVDHHQIIYISQFMTCISYQREMVLTFLRRRDISSLPRVNAEIPIPGNAYVGFAWLQQCPDSSAFVPDKKNNCCWSHSNEIHVSKTQNIHVCSASRKITNAAIFLVRTLSDIHELLLQLGPKFWAYPQPSVE